MITKPAKKMFVPLDSCFTDRTLNPRERADFSYLSETMIASLANIGQQTTGKVLKKDGRFLNLQGNRRWANMMECRKRGIIDPKTMKYDKEGKALEGTGKVFEAWEVEVYEDLTPREILELVVDQGTIRPLNKVETYYAFEQCAKVHYSELETIVILGDLLELHYPPTRAVKDPAEDKGKDLRDYYHGVMQTFRRIYEAPLVLHDACVAKLKGDQKWPTNAELTQGHKIHMDEMKADKTGTISRTRPGPKFMEFWDRKLKSVSEAETSGNKPKSVSMMTNQGLQDSKKTFDSRIGKWFHAFVLREVSPETAPAIDSLLQRFEKGEVVPADEVTRTLNEAFAATLTGDTAKTEEPAKAAEPTKAADLPATEPAKS